MKKKDVDINTEDLELKRKAKWASEKLVVKLLLEVIVKNYRICIDSTEGIKVWIENETEEDKLTDELKIELLEELQKHIK